jgi:predicted component of type VI protein secretion system
MNFFLSVPRFTVYLRLNGANLYLHHKDLYHEVVAVCGKMSTFEE